MEILGKLLGSQARVKLMRLFLLNKEKTFTTKEIVTRSRVTPPVVSRELRLFDSINFAKKKPAGWSFNPQFKYTGELEALLINADTLDEQGLITNFKKVGRVKLLIVSGVFIKNEDSRVDLLIVGDQMKKSKIEEAIRKLESEIGIEIIYSIFETKEFIYRLNMYDKLVRDILDFPHRVIIQAKELSTQLLKKA